MTVTPVPVLGNGCRLCPTTALGNALMPGGKVLPSSLPGLELWFDARYPNGFGGAVPADGDAVAQWNDLSGNARHVSQATASLRPLWRSANRNLLTYNQATFETDTSDWGVANNTSIARITSAALSGTACLEITKNVSIGHVNVTSSASRSPVTEGATYTAVASFKAPSAVRPARIVIRWYDGAGSYMGAQTLGGVVTTSTSWQKSIATAAAPVGAATAEVFLYVESAGVGEVFHADEVGIWAGSSTTWVPPVTLPGGMPVVQFDGGDDYLRATGFPVWANTTVYSVFQAMAYNPAVNTRALSIFGGAGSHDHYISASGQAAAKAGAARFMIGNVEAPGTLLLSSTYDGTTGAAWSKGTALSGGAAAGALGSSLDVGAAGGGSPSHTGVAAVLIYSTIHDTATRKVIERWLGQQFGIAVAA